MLRPRDEIHRVCRMLNEEMGTAQRIKCKKNRDSVVEALKSSIEKLRQFRNVPSHGLCLFNGRAALGDGKSKKISVCIEPPRDVSRFVYLCDDVFHLEEMRTMMITQTAYGFVIIDGNGCLCGAVTGRTSSVLHQFSVSLPKKHGRGGQSSNRFARLREEARHNYVRKVTEVVQRVFLDSNGQVNVQGIIFGGCGDLKTIVAESPCLDARLREKLMLVCDIASGGRVGLHEALLLASPMLKDLPLRREQELIANFFEMIAQDSDLVCYGIDRVCEAWAMGLLSKVIVWDDIDIQRVIFRTINANPAVETVKYLTPSEFVSKCPSGSTLVSATPLVEWFADTQLLAGDAVIELVSDCSQEGTQLRRGFGGLVGILRYPHRFDEADGDDEDE
eukprot:c3483_g1_i1.p1 GENE.c3483_g1_i1~~c3483_g1_i1.p1  ORF type:complete len:390 (+),score=91.38 c3483_g1_i1:249-1418(+)